jgi:hypothetical protein
MLSDDLQLCNASGKATEAKLLHPENLSMVCNASGKATEAQLPGAAPSECEQSDRTVVQ